MSQVRAVEREVASRIDDNDDNEVPVAQPRHGLGLGCLLDLTKYKKSSKFQYV
jgi:hypothetical protein